MTTTRKKIQIAPRLAGGLVRENFGSRMAPDVKDGLRAIAKHERKSMSWVVEEIVIDYFGLRRPKYDPRYLPKKQKNVVEFKRKRA